MSDEDSEICRFVFLLPDPLPFASERYFAGRVTDGFEERADDPLVICRFHHYDGPGATEAAMSALTAGWLAVRNEPSASPLPLDSSWTNSQYTIAEAFTTFDSPDDRGDAGRARLLGPRQDAFMRCLRFVDHWARAYRLASDAATERVTYERILPMVFASRVPGTLPAPEELDDSAFDELLAKPWNNQSSLLTLEHANLSDLASHDVKPALVRATLAWERMLYHGSPVTTWRERRLEALNAIRHGDLGLVLSFTYTAGEVLLDGTLTMLLWEEGLTPEAAAELFSHSVVRRCRTQMAPRLGGNWDANRHGPVKQWADDCLKLRGRVVHGGYEPHYHEAEAAIAALRGLESHVFSRIAEKRNAFKRTALMTLGQEGLERRGKWRGAIRKFHQHDADAEAPWNKTLSAWNRQLIEARLTHTGR